MKIYIFLNFGYKWTRKMCLTWLVTLVFGWGKCRTYHRIEVNTKNINEPMREFECNSAQIISFVFLYLRVEPNYSHNV